MATTFFILAGEASGDQHAARLITALKAQEPGARFVGMGGPQMAAAGLEVAKDLDGMQVVGFWEVAKKYGFFRRVFHALLDRLRQERPAALICVDYPGFNLRFAKEVRKLGIPVLYYIVPQVWAWKALRARSMAQYVDRCFCVFEFEPPFFEKFGLKTTFVGHPLVDHAPGENAVDRAAARRLLLPDGAEKIVGVFPGSRQSELQHHLPALEPVATVLAQHAPRCVAWFNYPPGHPLGRGTTGFHRDLTTPWPDPGALQTLTQSGAAEPACRLPVLSAAADYNVVKSGTSTLEAGLTGNPLCVLYRASYASYFLAHLLVNIPVFSLVNIVLGRYAVPELIQGDVNPGRLREEIHRGLFDEGYRERQRAALAELPRRLGGPGASARAAKGILDFLRGRE